MDYIGRYCLVRSRDAGVFVGTVVGVKGSVVEMASARRVWYWAGAATLSELAQRGTSNPQECKWPAPVDSIAVRGWCEIIPVSAAALATYGKVPVWTQ